MRFYLLAVASGLYINNIKEEDLVKQVADKHVILLLNKKDDPKCKKCDETAQDWAMTGRMYTNYRNVVVADALCETREELCKLLGFDKPPTLRVLPKGTELDLYEMYEGSWGSRHFNAFIQDRFKPERLCSVRHKKDCTPEQLVIVEESEKMSLADRVTKITELDEELTKMMEITDIPIDQVKYHKEEIGARHAQMTRVMDEMEWWALGGDTGRVNQLVSGVDLKAACQYKMCLIAFLPHIDDDRVRLREEKRKVLDEVFHKLMQTAKHSKYPVFVFWSQGGDQPAFESELGLNFGYPAVVIMNVATSMYSTYRGAWQTQGILDYVDQIRTGGVDLHSIPPDAVDKLVFVEPWDGTDDLTQKTKGTTETTETTEEAKPADEEEKKEKDDL